MTASPSTRLGLPALLALAALVALAACSKAGDPPIARPDTGATAAAPAPDPLAPAAAPAADEHADGIAWRQASGDAEVDAAFAVARAESKPVFLYWGAKWCPPCNQVKATLFNRADFIERSKAFIPVYVDGDRPGAQKLGSRFHVSGYPTLVLFKPDGTEVTRLPGEADPARYTELLDLGMNAVRPVKAVLAEALGGGSTLKPNDWRLLAFYSWDTDQDLLAKSAVAATLARLATACPAGLPETALRLRLKSLAAREAGAPSSSELAARPAVLAMLGDARSSREQADLLVNAAAEIAGAVSTRGSPERTAVLAAFDAALRRLQADATLSRGDRMQALIARVDLVRIDTPDEPGKPATPMSRAPVPADLLADVRAETARADREITDGYERQAVITSAAYLLERAGLAAESDALLEANLAKSHSPYYLMSELASNARKRGDAAAALRWYRQAFEKSEGPATRLQWGASYLNALVDLSPDDDTAIEATALQVWREAAAQPDAFHQRSERSLQRTGNKLRAWGAGGRHTATMARLRIGIDSLCHDASRTEPERASCAGLLAAPPKARA